MRGMGVGENSKTDDKEQLINMFPPESEAYGNLNRFFDGIHNRTEKPHKGECGLIEEEINGTKFLTMNHTDHLLYVRLLPSICPWEIMR